MRYARPIRTFLGITIISALSISAETSDIQSDIPSNRIDEENPSVTISSAKAPGVEESPVSRQISTEERRIRAGVTMLGLVHNTLARVKDKESAEAAVPIIVRLSSELQHWGQSMNALPPLDEATQSEYEKAYIPVIQKINERIKAQGERVAAAEFYGSQNLPAVLVKLVQALQ